MAKQTPEGRIKDKIKAILRKHNVYWHMPVQNGMGAPSLDFICCVRGNYLAIEAKAPGGKPTPRQLVTMRQINQAGGWTIVVSDDNTLGQLEFMLEVIGNDRRL